MASKKEFTEEVKKEVSAEATETKVAEVVEDTQSKTVTIAKAKGDDLVTFVPTVSGKSLIMGEVITYTAGKEFKIADSIAGILTAGKKGHKK